MDIKQFMSEVNAVEWGKFKMKEILAELGGLLILMAENQIELLTKLNPLQIDARQPADKQQIEDILTAEQCVALIRQSKEMING